MSTRDLYLRSTAAVIFPWALIVLPLASQNPERLLLAASPAMLIVIALNRPGPGINAAIVFGSTLIWIAGTAWLARRREIAIVGVGLLSFLLACGLSVLMRR